MLDHTKTPHISRQAPRRLHSPKASAFRDGADSAERNFTPWRELFRDLIEQQTEQGLYLSGLRCREGLTQKQLADQLSIGQAQVSKMERGLRSISEKTAKNLAVLFKVPYREFLTPSSSR